MVDEGACTLFFQRTGNFLTKTFPPHFIALAILLPGIAGYGASKYIEEIFVEKEMKELSATVRVPLPRAAFKHDEAPALKLFVEGDPFNAHVEAAGETKGAETNPEVLEELVLAGTMPGISAFFEGPEGLFAMLVGSEYAGFALDEVTQYSAFFERDGTRSEKRLRGKSDPNAEKKPARRTPTASVRLAGPVDGSVSRELVNKLLMNPLDELKNIRMRPKFDGETAQGVEIQWMADGSIFKSLGMERGDVVQAVNGVPIRNMGDVSNVINSLMSGNRFDVSVFRGGESKTMKYDVK